MRCAECVTDPLTPGHYCECCGRKLSIQERKALETAAAGVTCNHDAQSQNSAPVAPVARCESCGGPSADGGLCASCEQAFGPMLGRDTLVAPTLIDLVPAGEKFPVATLAPDIAFEVPQEDGPSAEEIEAQAAKAVEARAEAARKTAARVIADRAAAAEKRERETLARGPRPVAVMPTAPVPPPSRSRGMLLTVAAVAILGICGFTQRDLLMSKLNPAQTAADGQDAQPVLLADAGIPTAAARATASPRPKAAAAATAPAHPRAVRPPVEAVSTPSTATKPGTAVKPSKPVKPNTPVKPVARVATAAPAAVAHAASAPAVFAPVAAARPRSVQNAAATGKFFEANDVDVSPKVARRIEPQIPADLKGRSINDIVIVRVLVSQDGDASHVSLLRKSKHGRSVDEAVLAAVTQWSFLPAKKKGAAVSSWYNVGVPVGQNN